MPTRVAILGAGPSGFYAADQLLAAGFEVDMLDRLPTPFGLVRAGVAPDHPKIKSVTRVYEKTAARPGFRWFGGVELGTDVTRDELRRRYDAVVYAIGTATDRRLGIPGEDLAGSHPATDFVAWYNGHPDFCDHDFALDRERAVVVGNGNVAIDVARMLVLATEELGATDTADHALEAFHGAGVTDVVLLGRRGPAQAAFTNPELRELADLSRAEVAIDPAELELEPSSEAALADDAGARRNVELLRDYAAREPAGRSHRIVLAFRRSPVEILGDADGRVRAVRVVRNRLEADADGRLRAVATGEQETVECGLVLRAVGYRGTAIPGVPFDERAGLIPNVDGRVVDAQGAVSPGEYVVGWIKRGPSGVIGTNKKDAAGTTRALIADAQAGRLPAPAEPGADLTLAWLRSRVPDLVDWAGWQAIDAHERALGEPAGRPRVKLVHTDELRRIARGE